MSYFGNPGSLRATGPNKYGDVKVALVTSNGFLVSIAHLATETDVLQKDDGKLLTKQEMTEMAVKLSHQFAAAPEMMEAIEFLLLECPGCSAAKKARAVIAKANGKEPEKEHPCPNCGEEMEYGVVGATCAGGSHTEVNGWYCEPCDHREEDSLWSPL